MAPTFKRNCDKYRAELVRALPDITWREFQGEPNPAVLAAGFNTVLLIIRLRHVCASDDDVMNARQFAERANLFYRKHGFSVRATVEWVGGELPNPNVDPREQGGWFLLDAVTILLCAFLVIYFSSAPEYYPPGF